MSLYNLVFLRSCASQLGGLKSREPTFNHLSQTISGHHHMKLNEDFAADRIDGIEL